jgi:lycopene cyclase domain-containing protein
MTYAEFLALFVLPGLALVVYWCRAELKHIRALATIVLVVYATATPWDNGAVHMGLWFFAPDRILGLKVGQLPIEECAFFGLQTLIVALWTLRRWEQQA